MRLGSVLFLVLAMHTILAEEVDEERFQFDIRKEPVLEKEKELRAETVRIYDITSQMEKEIKQPATLPPFFQLPQFIPLPIVAFNEEIPIAQKPEGTKMTVNAKEITQNQTKQNTDISKQEGDKINQTLTPTIQEEKRQIEVPQTQKIDILPIYKNSSTAPLTLKPNNDTSKINNNQNASSSSPSLQPPGNLSSLPSFVPSVISSTETQPPVSSIPTTQPSIPPPLSLPSTQNNKNILKNVPQKKPSFQSLNQFETPTTQLSPNRNSPLNESKQHSQISFPQTNLEQQGSYLITVILFAVIILTVGTIFGVGRIVMRRRKTENIRFPDSSAIREDIQTPKLSKNAEYNQTQNNFTDMVEEYDVSHSD